ncbi:MAG: 2-oxoacid:ferredoxin oxidoreductase subunit gamma [Candidatus Methanomethylicota archaeon]|nr:MAG: 2-oxoacid:ferredoxin oxidoreductase subunit gamma [Candidatus Verstraetearchaeota archaeon]
MKLRVEIRICGLGGQGVILAGELLGLAAVLEGKYATQTRSYGSEARGSACKSDVVISDEAVRYPLIEKCDIMIAMSQPSINIYAKTLKKNGILIFDSDLVKKVPKEIASAKLYGVKATRIAEEKYARIVANLIMLGFTAELTGIVSVKSLEEAVKSRIRRMVDLNIAALREGAKLAKAQKR